MSGFSPSFLPMVMAAAGVFLGGMIGTLSVMSWWMRQSVTGVRAKLPLWAWMRTTVFALMVVWTSTYPLLTEWHDYRAQFTGLDAATASFVAWRGDKEGAPTPKSVIRVPNTYIVQYTDSSGQTAMALSVNGQWLSLGKAGTP